MPCSIKNMCGECELCLPLSFASHPRAANWSEKNALSPRQIFANTHKLFWFLCEKCNHEFEICPRDVGRGSWCCYCAVPAKELCRDADCRFCFQRSFASVEFSKFWSESNDQTPRQVLKNTHDKYTFECTVCLHSFDASPNNASRGKHCPFCATVSRALCDSKDCKFCFDRSFASNPKSQDWIDTRTTPRQVMLNSNSKYRFRCSNCNHEYMAALNKLNRDCLCPYCCVPGKLLCADENCQHCLSRSFASHPHAINWSSKNLKLARNVFLGSCSKFIFVCPDCDNDFSIRICHVAKGQFCAICRNKTEKKFLAWLQQTFPYFQISYQVRYKWCYMGNSRCKMPFDFVIEELKLAIEVQGAQHYTQIRNFQAPEVQAERDARKMKLAMEHGYTVVAVLQEPVWADKEDWQTKIAACIKRHESPTAYTVRMGLPSTRKGFLQQFRTALQIQPASQPDDN